METLYVNNNGEILVNEGGTIRAGNRGHLYGDGLFETIRIFNGRAINLSIHITRLLDGMRVLKMRIPAFYTPEFFQEKIDELIQKSAIKEGGRIRLSVDRVSGGSYKPDSNEVVYFIEVYPYKYGSFVLNDKGLELELYTKIKKPSTPFENYKVKNALVHVLAAIEGEELKVDDMLLTNNRGGIVEATSSNIFIVSNDILYTPGLEEGCVGGIMRMTIINLALEHNIRVYESPITPQNLLIADEIILTNAVCGVQWVSGYRTKRYTNKMGQRLVGILNEHFSKD